MMQRTYVKWAALFGYNLCCVQKSQSLLGIKILIRQKRVVLSTRKSLWNVQVGDLQEAAAVGGGARVELVDHSEDNPKFGPKTQVLVFWPDNLLLLANILVSPRGFNYIDPN